MMSLNVHNIAYRLCFNELYNFLWLCNKRINKHLSETVLCQRFVGSLRVQVKWSIDNCVVGYDNGDDYNDDDDDDDDSDNDYDEDDNDD